MAQPQTQTQEVEIETGIYTYDCKHANTTVEDVWKSDCGIALIVDDTVIVIISTPDGNFINVFESIEKALDYIEKTEGNDILNKLLTHKVA